MELCPPATAPSLGELASPSPSASPSPPPLPPPVPVPVTRTPMTEDAFVAALADDGATLGAAPSTWSRSFATTRAVVYETTGVGFYYRPANVPLPPIDVPGATVDVTDPGPQTERMTVVVAAAAESSSVLGVALDMQVRGMGRARGWGLGKGFGVGEVCDP